MLAGFLALLSAATFAFNNASLRRGVLTGSVAQAMAITVPIGVPLFFIAALLSGTLALIADFPFDAVLILSGSGVVHFLWGRYCNYRATQAIGSNLTAPLQQVNFLVSLALAMLVLGETLTPLRILGIGLVLLGPYFAMYSDEKPAAAAARREDRHQREQAAAVQAEIYRRGHLQPALGYRLWLEPGPDPACIGRERSAGRRFRAG